MKIREIHPFCKTMGEIIQEKTMCELNKNTISKMDIVKKMNISANSLWLLVNGRSNPNITTILSICNTLNISVSELMKETEIRMQQENQN